MMIRNNLNYIYIYCQYNICIYSIHHDVTVYLIDEIVFVIESFYVVKNNVNMYTSVIIIIIIFLYNIIYIYLFIAYVEHYRIIK